ncbi:MAG: ABC transporter ATP-binding protein [Candidatus Kerfeldbacteria bacterium]|nr:ABC transporter ATP-binding protein [Candidatus Kerfeldbacteria bacterium]
MKRVTKQTLQLFWHHVRRYPGLGITIVIALLVAVSAGTIAPIYYRDFFDLLSNAQTKIPELRDALIRILLIVFGLRLLEQAGYRVGGFSMIAFSGRVMRNIEDACFAYLHQHSVGFFIHRFVGSIVRKVGRIVRAYDVIADSIIWELYPLALKIIIMLVVIATQHTVLAAALFGWVVVYIGINYWFSEYKLRFDAQRAAVDSEVGGNLADTITNNVNVKIFTSFPEEVDRHAEITERRRRVHTYGWTLDESMYGVQAFLFAVLELGIFYLALGFWEQGILTVGDLVLLQVYVISIFTHIWNFGRTLRNIYEHLADAEEMVEMLNLPHEVQNKPHAKELHVTKGLVEFRNVDFAYQQTRSVLKHFELTIQPGEKVGLVGPSGAGKTTITALLLRYYDVTKGSIFIDGQNIADVTQDSLRAQLSLVPQDPVLFHRTLGENIRYGRRDATDAEVREASKLAHCDEFIEQLPHGYETFVGERGIRLSGGERQRVAIARAILKNAPVLILDEATSSLDSHSERLIQDALGHLMEGKTTIVIAHRLSTIMKMDRIVVIDHGEVVEMGTHIDLLKKGGLYHQLWTMQAGGFIE